MAATTRWNPWSDLINLHSQMDQLFDASFGSGQTGRENGYELANLPVDIHQTDDAYTIDASVPGFRPEDVEVTLEDGVLTIRGSLRSEHSRDDKGYIRRERRQTSVYRQIGLPQEVQTDGINASFSNGVLTVRVPRTPKAQPKRIPVTIDAQARLVSSDEGKSKD